MKRIGKIKLLLVASLILIVFMTPNVSAMSINNLYDSAQLIIIDENNETFEDTLDERLRSTSLPTTALDLSKQCYKANIVRATRNWLYTNVYFKVSSHRTINISYNLSSNNGQNARIAVYDMTSGDWVQEKRGLVGSMSVTDLKSSHKYVVAFVGYQTGLGTTVINGTAIITN